MEKEPKIGIVAFGFGEPAHLVTNRAIADCTRMLVHSTRSSVVFTDRDVEPHLRDLSVLVEQIDPNRFPSTYRLGVLAIERAKHHELNHLHVVAAPCHLWRCMRDLRWVAQECGMKIVLIPQQLEGFQYDPSAVTTYTRSGWHWWPPEIAFRILSTLFQGWYKKRGM